MTRNSSRRLPRSNHERGYTIVPNVIELDLVEALDDTLLRLERRDGIGPGRNSFEGHNTIRIYNLLARGDAFARVPVHRNVLPIVEGVLDQLV